MNRQALKHIIILMMEKFKQSSLALVGCKNEYHETYTLKYFYIEYCSMCEQFTKKGLPLIKEEFGSHMKIIEYDMDDDKSSEAYQQVVDKLASFDEDAYGRGPFLVLDDYYVQLGVDDVNDYLDNLIMAIKEKRLNKPGAQETYFYFKDGKIKEE